MALQTKEFTGSTGSTYWTWKIKVIENNYTENGVVSTNKVNITIEEYLGRKSTAGDSFFDGKATLKFVAGSQSKSKSFTGGSTVKAGAWYKIGTHTFEGVENNGTIENPTKLPVSGELVDAVFSPKTAKASGTISLTPLHTPPVINSVEILETDGKMTSLSVPNDTIVQFLSKKKLTVNSTFYDDATIKTVSVYHNNVLIGTSSTNEVTVDFSQVGELLDSGTGFIGLVVAVTDSLGGYITKIFDYAVIKYTRPSIEATSTSIKRKTGGGISLIDNIAVLNFVGTCYKGNDIIGNANKPTLQYKIWNVTEPDYTTIDINNVGSIKIENFQISNIAYTSTYEYKIKLNDIFTNSAEEPIEKTGVVPTGVSVWTEYKDRVDFLKLTIKQNNIFTYEKGETFSLDREYFGGGYLTSSKEKVQFTIPVDKSLANISTITVKALKGNFRSVAGGYIGGASEFVSGGYDYFADSNYTFEVVKCSDNLVSIWVQKSSDFDATNNTPVAVEINALTLEFN